MVHELLTVEVAYANEINQYLITLQVADNTTVWQAIEQSGLLGRCPEISRSTNKVGIFSQQVGFDDSVKTGDRIEIYRALICDPREIRRQRAMKSKQAPIKHHHHKKTTVITPSLLK